MCSSWRGWEQSAGLQTPSTPSTPSTREDFLSWGPATSSSSPSLPQPWSTQTIPPATSAPSAWTSERKGWKKKKEQMGRWMDKWVGWRLLNIRWLENGSFRTLAWILNPQCLLGQIHWRMEGLEGLKASLEWTLQEDGVKGKRKSGFVFLTLC